MAEYHSLSGKVPLGGLVRITISGLTSAAFLAIIYAYAIVYIPFIYLNVFATVIFGWLIGWFVGGAARRGKVRNVTFAAIAGLLFGFIGLYFAWAVDMVARLGRLEVEEVRFTLDPRILWNYVCFVNKEGLWTLRGSAPTGWSLTGIWIIEALMIVGAATMASLNAVHKRAFCEGCERWIETEDDVLRLDASGREAVVSALEYDRLEVFSEIAPAEPDAPDFLRLDVASCPRCGESDYLTVQQLTTTVGKDGKAEVKKDEVVMLQRITAADLEYIRELSAKIAADHAAAEVPQPESDASVEPDIDPSDAPS